MREAAGHDLFRATAQISNREPPFASVFRQINAFLQAPCDAEL
jgi:hypothetical protein